MFCNPISMDYAGLIFDESFHYIDHLAPFCSLSHCPLIACEPSVAELVRLYYPDLEVIEAAPLKLSLPKHVIACDTRPILHAAFPQMRNIEIFWLPHGNSDKGWKSPFFEALQEETCLVYGQKMIDFMRQKNVRTKLFRVGNFRWRYFDRHQSFYKKTIQEEIVPHLPKGNKNFLYAPTWEDSESNGCFWKVFTWLADALPNEVNLLVKLHPNTRRRFEVQLEVLQGRYENKCNIFFLPEFPPIYPLLTLCDAYIGDMSSIGYDFLKLDKPLFFINNTGQDAQRDPSLFLYRCGTQIPLDRLTSLFNFNESEELSARRKEVYDYTFDSTPVDMKEIFHS